MNMINTPYISDIAIYLIDFTMNSLKYNLEHSNNYIQLCEECGAFDQYNIFY